MKFGPVALAEAEGAILAHSHLLNSSKRLRKGIKLSSADLADLARDGVTEVIVARPDESEIHENDAATIIAEMFDLKSVRRDSAKTGRVNFFATQNGVFEVSKTLVDALNSVDPMITFATLDNFADVNEGRIVATVKIIPYAVPKTSLGEDKINRLGALFSSPPLRTIKSWLDID